MSEHLHRDRRGFLCSATLALAALRFGESRRQPRNITDALPVRRTTTAAPLGPVKQIDAGLLNVDVAHI